MKKKNFFMLALAAIAFAACSNEDIVPGGKDNNDVVNLDGDAWVALSVQSTKTRALNTPNQDNGTADESNITAVKAVFFDGHVNTSVVTKIVTFSDEDINNLPNRTSAFKVPSTSKAVLIIANPQNLARTIKEGDKYEDVNEIVTLSTEAEVTTGVAKSGGFVMTNAKGDLEPSESDGTAKNLALYSTAIAATNSPLTIRIDRISAKVRVYVKADSGDDDDLSDNATIDKVNTKWYLNVTNKKFFPFKKANNEDPNFPMSTTLAANYNANFFTAVTNVTAGENAVKYDIQRIEEDDKRYTEGIYCLENTINIDTESSNDFSDAQKVATYLKVAAKFTPKNIDGETNLTEQEAKNRLSGNGTFYTCKKVPTSMKDMCYSNISTGIDYLRESGLTVTANEFITYEGGWQYYETFVNSPTDFSVASGIIRNNYYIINVTAFNTLQSDKTIEVNTTMIPWVLKGRTTIDVETGNN